MALIPAVQECSFLPWTASDRFSGCHDKIELDMGRMRHQEAHLGAPARLLSQGHVSCRFRSRPLSAESYNSLVSSSIQRIET